MSRAGTLATVLSLLVAGAVEAQPSKTWKSFLKRSYLGKPLPDFKADRTDWINATGGLSLKQLHGRPTLVVYTVLW